MKILAVVFMFGILTVAAVTAMPILDNREAIVIPAVAGKVKKGNNKKRTRGRKRSHQR